MTRPTFGAKLVPDSEAVGLAQGGPQLTVDSAGAGVPAASELNAEVARADDLAAQFLQATRSPASPGRDGGSAHASARSSADAPALRAKNTGTVVRPAFRKEASHPTHIPEAMPPEESKSTYLGSDDPFALVPPKRVAAKGKDMPDLGRTPPSPPPASPIPSDLDAFDPPAAPVYGANLSPFGKKNSLSGPAVRALRADIKAASIVTDLVSAMAVHPGSEADVAIKSKLLTSLLVSARKSAEDLIEMVDPARADVGWVRAQALSQTASMLAAEWTKGPGVLDEAEVRRRLDLRMALVHSLLTDRGGEVEAALAAYAEGDYYKACTDAQSASDHRAVAIHQTAWIFSDAVCRVQDKSGVTYSFGLPSEEVVAALLQQTVSIVMATRPEIRDADAASTWMRGAMRRAARLVAAEYSNKAIESCARKDMASSEQEQFIQEKDAPARFNETVIPFIAHWGVKNFQSIERASRQVIEESQDELESADRPGH